MIGLLGAWGHRRRLTLVSVGVLAVVLGSLGAGSVAEAGSLPQFRITPTSLEFGPVQVGTTASNQTVTVTNVGGGAVVMSGAGGGVGAPFTGFQDCQGKTLNPGDSCHMVYGFAPTSAGPASTTSSGSWNGQNFNIALSGTGINPQFLISPTSLDFGPVHIGSTSSSQSVTVTNLGSSAVVMSGAGGGVGSPFSGFQSCQGKTLNPGNTCQMVYAFSPTATGPASTTSSGDWNGQSFNIALQGIGLEQFLITPTSLDFGQVPVGTIAPSQAVTVTNMGTSPVVMSGAGGGVSSPFSGFQSCQGKTLNPAASCQMVYSFMATASGPASTNSIGDWNGQNFNIALSGNGRGAQFVITPTSLDFGPVQVGSSAPSQTVTVTNVGPSPVVMSGAGGGVGSPFSGFQSCQGNTLNPGATCQMVYDFSPTAAGPAGA
ncbi:MAG TPA: choice-of-anchor D domain-containing protein, partial [Candidatus Dormibacteraeota bacterium]|nr:choice-of-anchor D domain-containing protein [Candidatus Dormibacteraeota bacterium]